MYGANYTENNNNIKRQQMKINKMNSNPQVKMSFVISSKIVNETQFTVHPPIHVALSIHCNLPSASSDPIVIEFIRQLCNFN